MKPRQWVRLAIVGVSCIGVLALDWVTNHYSIASSVALVMVICLDGWCDADANEKQERIDELQREVRLLAATIGDRGRPGSEPTDTGIFEK
jgi:hypothetical protein